MAESDYQRKIKRIAEESGWTVIKLVRATVNGYPDLLCLHPIRGVVFIEVKDVGGKLSKLQEYRLADLSRKGFEVIVADPDTRTLADFQNLFSPDSTTY